MHGCDINLISSARLCRIVIKKVTKYLMVIPSVGIYILHICTRDKRLTPPLGWDGGSRLSRDGTESITWFYI